MNFSPFRIFLLATTLSILPGNAEQFGEFTYRVVNETIEIVDYPKDLAGHVEIPSAIEGKPVTAITGGGDPNANDGAFASSMITSVTIPESVTRIGSGAFGTCFNLESVIIPDSVKMIEDSAFYQCHRLVSVTLGSGVESIGELAFFICFRLTSLEIPDSVTTIAERAFVGCSAMSHLTLGSGLTEIGDSAFSRCSALTSLDIPDGVTFIGNNCFNRCSRLSTLKIGSGLTATGQSTFAHCTGLSSVSLGSGLTTIGVASFANCHLLKSISIPENVTSIESSAFSRCGLKSISIPTGVTLIENFAFDVCPELSSAVFQGGAPETFGIEVFGEASPDFKIYFLSESSGFTSPTWNGFPSQAIGTAPSPSESWLLSNGFPLGTDLDQDVNGDGITYKIESSADLKEWDSDGVELSLLDQEGRRTASVNRSSIRRFMRLVVALE